MAQFYIDRLLQIADIRDRNERKDIIKAVNEHTKVFTEKDFCNLHRLFLCLKKVFGIYYGARLTKGLLKLRFLIKK